MLCGGYVLSVLCRLQMRYAMVNFYNLQLLDKMRRNVFSLRGNISHRKEASYLACYQLLAIKIYQNDKH